MKLPNGYGSVKKLSGNRRNPYAVRITTGWEIDPVTEKKKQKYITIGYAPTKKDGLQMLAEYHQNPFDTKAAKTTFQEIYYLQKSIKYSEIFVPYVCPTCFLRYKIFYFSVLLTTIHIK